MFKKAFTLVEVLIAAIISGILFILLSKAFITASQLYIYEKNQKNVEKDILFINQNLQNLADSTEIDYSKYSNLENTL
jgi:prepilin-type N-terminal cleavage/methylation domain-containing protein